MKRLALTVFYLSLMTLALAACGDGGSPARITREAREAQESQSRWPCDHMRNVARDYSAGLLTFPEFRGKLQEVYRDAAGATPQVYAAAKDMLAAATALDPARLTAAVTAMGDACASAGW